MQNGSNTVGIKQTVIWCSDRMKKNKARIPVPEVCLSFFLHVYI